MKRKPLLTWHTCRRSLHSARPVSQTVPRLAQCLLLAVAQKMETTITTITSRISPEKLSLVSRNAPESPRQCPGTGRRCLTRFCKWSTSLYDESKSELIRKTRSCSKIHSLVSRKITYYTDYNLRHKTGSFHAFSLISL